MIRAAVLEEPEKLTVRNFDEPAVANDTIIFRTLLTGICGTDIHLYAGHLNVQFPLIPGHELVGVVEGIGRDAIDEMTVMGSKLREGDRVALVPSSAPCGKCYQCLNHPHRTSLCGDRTVYGFRSCAEEPKLVGGFSEYMVVTPGSFLFKLPDNLDTELATLIEPTAVALRVVERALAPGLPSIGEGLGIGGTALVVGTGPIGLLVIACLNHFGIHRTIAVDVNTARLGMAKELGAEIVDGSQLNREERLSRVLEMTEGAGANYVFECAGVPQAFEEALDLACRGGIVVEPGHFTDSGPATIRPHLICNKDLDIRGVWAYPWFQFRDAISLLATTQVPLHPLITHRVKLNEVEDAMRDGFGGTMIKGVVDPWL